MSRTPTASLADLRLFTGEPKHDVFSRFSALLPTARMTASGRPHVFEEGAPLVLPASFRFEGEDRSVEDFLRDTDTAALVVLRNGRIRLERYALTGGRDVNWISWSVAKSFVSAMVGIALEEGLIGSIDQPISDYVKVQPGSAYDGVLIRHVLQMSSGARWNEDYNDPSSDVHRLAAAMSGATTLDAFVATMAREAPPGTVCRYNSGDTQALGGLLASATGRSLADYMQVKLCDPLGFEADSYWLVDAAGREMAFGGLLVTARDFAKLGELYRNGGRWGGRQIVPEAWVRASVRADAPHLQPGKPIIADHPLDMGYGYQWWLPEGERGEFSAIGIYNQFVYTDPQTGVVIVKLSANRTYGLSMDERDNRELENVALLRAISQELGQSAD